MLEGNHKRESCERGPMSKTTSKSVARKASSLLRSKSASKKAKSVAASALSQVEKKKTKDS